jgi:hypothetical protein
LRVPLGNALQALRNVVQCFVPRHRFKVAAALGTHTPQRLQYALGVVGALGVARHLGAQRAIGVAVLRIALDLDGHAVLYGGHQGAGVRAVVRAGAAHLTGSFQPTDGGGCRRGQPHGIAHSVTL